jgi:hypothetical protein
MLFPKIQRKSMLPAMWSQPPWRNIATKIDISQLLSGHERCTRFWKKSPAPAPRSWSRAR